MVRKHTRATLKYLIISLFLIVSCSSDEESFINDVLDTDIIKVTFHPSLDNTHSTKAIGDAGKIDQLTIGVYKDSPQGLCKIELMNESWSDVQKNGVALELDSQYTYKILFWAGDADNTAYRFGDDGAISVDYSSYTDSGFSKMEELDAFYAVSSVNPGQTQEIQKVILTRPMAQLNFADIIRPETGIHTAKVIFHSMPVTFNPFTGKVTTTDHIDSSDDITFTFIEFPSETLKSSGVDYNYLSSNYIFAPSDGITEAACTVILEKEGLVLSQKEFKGKKSIVIRQKQKINIVDRMVPEPQQWSIWNGKFPTVCPIDIDPDNQDSYIIDDAEDIVWLGEIDNAGSLGKNKTFRLTTNIDMDGKPGQRSLKLPEGSRFEGDNHTIKGLKMMVGLFGNFACNLTVKNLIIEGAEISSTTNSNKGILANTLSGSSIINNVIVCNSSINCKDAVAGGLVGYIRRKDIDNRAEQVEVVFDNCHVINTEITGGKGEGYFVGVFRGYDNGEKLIFKDNCSVTPFPGEEVADSYFCEGNEAVWISATDFSNYNGWLGYEECYRGMVYFENTRFIPKWDGKTVVTPLLADPTYDDSDQYKVASGKYRYVIYSPFDLAGARKKTSTPKALYFKTSVDMNGQGEDGVYGIPDEFAQSKCKSDDDNWFNPFAAIKDIDGQNNTIYNLGIHSQVVSEKKFSAAFVRSVHKDTITTHKNLIFRNCCSVAPVIQRGYGGNDGDDESIKQDLSVGAILIFDTGSQTGKGEPKYTMENIHIYDSQVFALQHSGILAGILTHGNAYNCSVNNSRIENYRCRITPEPFVKNVNIAGSDIEISADFYSHGEIGALFGNIRRESNVSNCHVRNSIVHAYHESDKMADMSSDGFLGKAAIASAKALGFYLVPGRHVSTMIGDIRTMNGETITINNCTVDAATKCTADYNKHNDSYPYIGQAYYIQFQDTKGKVLIDGHELTLADGNKNTQR